MKTFSLILLLLAVTIHPAWAKKKGGAKPAPALEYKIVEASGVSITVTHGKSGDVNEVFKITDATKVTLDGVPSAGRDLRAGMIATVEAGGDHAANVIHAKTPPPHPAKKRVG